MTETLNSAPKIAALHWQTATIDEVVLRTPSVTSYFLKLSQPFAFRAGQHIDVRLTAADGYQAQRSYSIASAPALPAGAASARIELAIERLDSGEVSAYFDDIAIVGDEIEIRGPIGGHFVWSARDIGATLLIGGGSGIAPLMSMVRHRADVHSLAPTLLLYAARSWDDLIFRDELIAMHDRDDGFKAVFTLSRESVRRQGDYARRIDAPMLHEILAHWAVVPDLVLICGANPFVETAAQGLIDACVPARSIRTERYGS